MPATLHAAVSFQKLAGTLSLHPSHLAWTPSSSSSSQPPLKLALSAISGLSQSKPGAAQTLLGLALNEAELKDDCGLVPGKRAKAFLTFTAEGDKAVQERAAFKDGITEGIRRAKAQKAAAGGDGTAATSTDAAATKRKSEAAPSSTSTPPGKKPRLNGEAAATPQASTSRSGTGTPAADMPISYGQPKPLSEIQLRTKILRANPSLLSLHRSTVFKGLLSDAEFWSHPTRRALLTAERQLNAQRLGRTSRLVDPKLHTDGDGGGNVKVDLDQRMIRDIFEQNPIVWRAWNENVPEKMDEPTFWTRYFQSKLYHRLRTSHRSNAALQNAAPGGYKGMARLGTIQDDENFDRYLEEDGGRLDDALEPLRRAEPTNALLDLGATAEDHGETGNEADFTMRAGGERRNLPLMRRFNEHSGRVLGEEMRSRGVGGWNRREERDDEEEEDQAGEAGKRYREDIVIEELEEREKSRAIRLDVRAQRELLEGTQRRNGERGEGKRNGVGKGSRTNGVAMERRSDEQLSSILSQISASLRGASSGSEDARAPSTWSSLALSFADADAGGEAAQRATLGEFKPDPKGSAIGMKAIVRNVRSRADKGRKDDLPEDVTKALTASHQSLTEFLRQFWSAMTPSVDDEVFALPKAASSRRGANASADGEEEDKRREKEIMRKRAEHARRMLGGMREEWARAEELQRAEGLDEEQRGRVRKSLDPTEIAIQKAEDVAREFESRFAGVLA